MIKNVIKNKSDLKRWLNEELRFYPTGRFQYLFQIGENAILKRHQILLRKTEYYINTNNRILGAIYKIKLYRIQNKYGINIPINCCGKGFRLMHLGPVLVNGNATIGKNCSMHMNSAVVASGPKDLAPVLGDNVVIGYGAVIVGGINIADDVAVGANAVVCKSITEPDIAVAGVPAKKVSDNGRSKWNTKT